MHFDGIHRKEDIKYRTTSNFRSGNGNSIFLNIFKKCLHSSLLQEKVRNHSLCFTEYNTVSVTVVQICMLCSIYCTLQYSTV